MGSDLGKRKRAARANSKTYEQLAALGDKRTGSIMKLFKIHKLFKKQTNAEHVESTRKQLESTTLDPPSTAASTRPAEPTLQGIPGELRNKIFELATAIEEKRTIVGWKSVKAHAEAGYDKSTLRQQFESAAVAHPLSMTCRKLHHDFAVRDTSSTALTYELVVSNFDLDQIDLFLHVIEESGISRENVLFRPQIDNNIAQSARVLRETVKKGSFSSDSKESQRHWERLFMSSSPHLTPFSVRMKYRPPLGGVDWSKTATHEQLQEADEAVEEVLRYMDLTHVWHHKMLFIWLKRFHKMSQESRLQGSRLQTSKVAPSKFWL